MAASARGRTSAYSEMEVEKLNDLVEYHLPQGADEWEKVGSEFRSAFNRETNPRSNESLKLKYKTLRLHKKPTGDPDCPHAVKRAKRIYREIEAKGFQMIEGDELEDEIQLDREMQEPQGQDQQRQELQGQNQ